MWVTRMLAKLPSSSRCSTTSLFKSSMFTRSFSIQLSDFVQPDVSQNPAFAKTPPRNMTHPGWNHPQPRETKIDHLGRAYGKGGRKTSVARVWIKPGDGTMVVNGKLHSEYFPLRQARAFLCDPFIVTQSLTKFDVWCTVKGGGMSGVC